MISMISLLAIGMGAVIVVLFILLVQAQKQTDKLLKKIDGNIRRHSFFRHAMVNHAMSIELIHGMLKSERLSNKGLRARNILKTSSDAILSDVKESEKLDVK